MNRRTLLLAAGVMAATAAVPAFAATQAAYTEAAFAAAQTAGRPILLAAHADWCPTCTKQKPIVNSLMQKPEFRDLVILNIDFDNQKDVLKAFGVTQQSTMIVMHGKIERGRAVGITSENAIQGLMEKALS